MDLKVSDSLLHISDSSQDGAAAVRRKPKLPESGLVLLDMSWRPVAFDDGALLILACYSGNGSGSNGDRTVPGEIIQAIRGLHSEQNPGFLRFVAGERQYRVRCYLIKYEDARPRPAMVAVHFEYEDHSSGNSHVAEGICAIAVEYRLTRREEQVLRGIAAGLGTKEMADRMGISPNTVKCFVRLIMTKMGVVTRGAIMVKLLEHGTAPEATILSGGRGEHDV